MLFLYAFLAELAAYATLLAIRGLALLFKKGKFAARSFFLKNPWDMGASLLLVLGFALALQLLFGGVGMLNASLMLYSFAFVFLLVSPIQAFLSAGKKGQPFCRKSISAALAVTLMALEVFACNQSAYKNQSETQECAFTSSLVNRLSGFTKDEEGDYVIRSGSYFEVKELDQHAGEIFALHFEDAPSSFLYVDFYTTANNGGSWTKVSSVSVNPSLEESAMIRLPSGLTSLTKVAFSIDTGRINSPSSLRLSGFALNAQAPFLYSPIRYFGLLGLVYFFFHLPEIFQSKAAKGDELSRGDAEKAERLYERRIYRYTGIFMAVSLVVLLAVVFSNKDTFFLTKEYVETNVQNNASVDIYSDLFLALTRGKIQLNVTPSEALLEMESSGLNVYDRTLRDGMGVSSCWDHAYYHGAYYCYYGIFPIFACYFPLYWLSGGTLIARPLTAGLFGMIFLVPCFFLLTYEISKLLGKRNNLKHLFFVFFVAFFTSMTIAALTFKDAYFHEGIYHLPIIYALLTGDLFLLFAFRAYRHEKRRMLSLALSGLFFVFLLCCRPGMVFLVLVPLPLFLKLLFHGEGKFGKRLLAFAPMFLVLAVGAVLICLYNYQRFDSILEFGQSYQINYDQTHLTYSLDKLFPSILHFFFQAPAFYNQFPYLSCASMRLSFDNVPYNQSYYGVLLVPAFWIVLANPFLYKKDNAIRVAISMPFLFALLEAFTTYSKAGICPRYLLEIYHVMSLGMIAGFFAVLDHYESGKQESLSLPIVLSVIGLFSAFITFNLAYDSFDGQNVSDLGGMYVKLREAFMVFNY